MFDRATSRRRSDATDCGCTTTVVDGALRVDADDCPADGDLAAAPGCRRTVVEVCTARAVDAIRVRSRGFERRYGDHALAVLTAAGRFRSRLAGRDDPLAATVETDPLAAARTAASRAAPVCDWAASTGLLLAARGVDDYGDLQCVEGPTIAPVRIRVDVPVDWTIQSRETLSTGAIAALCRDDRDRPRYHLRPTWVALDDTGRVVFARAYRRLAAGANHAPGAGSGSATASGSGAGSGSGSTSASSAASGSATASGSGAGRGSGSSVGGAGGGDPLGAAVAGAGGGADGPTPSGHVARAHRRAVDVVADGDPDDRVVQVLRRHTTGDGVLEHLFADPAVSDVYAPSNPEGAPLRVDHSSLGSVPTNCRLTADGATALASAVRADSGRAFSRATPTVDAATTVDGVPIRVAGVRDPVADGVGFAFRRGTDDPFTLPALIANGTVPPRPAALLSLATRRAAATLVAGARGAGKTTLLGALCFELEPTTRTVLVEDTPELPVDALRADDRDVQGLRTSERGDGLDAAGALRTALRLGEGALVVGEVRGTEAQVLYEAMRVGASSDAVLGTIHGDGAAAVRERVVADLGVAPSSFAVTDCVVTCRRVPGPEGAARRVARIEEVVGDGDNLSARSLYELGDDGVLESTDRIARGNSTLVASLAKPGNDYADVREALDARAARLQARAETGRHDPGAWGA